MLKMYTELFYLQKVIRIYILLLYSYERKSIINSNKYIYVYVQTSILIYIYERLCLIDIV